jgi:thiamine biosynthesis lipoprotein
MAQKAGLYTLPTDAEPLLDTYKILYTATGGAFTPLIGKVLVEAGYDAQYSLQRQQLTTPEPWESVLNYNYPTLTLKKPALLDFGAGGKGYLVDIVSTLIKEDGVASFCVDASGDMYYHTISADKLDVGLEHPDNTDQVIGVAHIHNQSMCGTAGNRRRWDTFHHTINPHTLTSPEHISAIWVIAQNTLIADALTTCLYFTSPQKLLETYQFEYVIMYSDHSIKHSPNFPGEFFT